MNITITPGTAKAILLIEDRYYFDLFRDIRTNEDEEYTFRDAIAAVAKEIKLQGAEL